jgi:integrase
MTPATSATRAPPELPIAAQQRVAAVGIDLAARRQRWQRGSLRNERGYWVLRIRLESPDSGSRRREQSMRIGPASELKTRQAARLEADRRLKDLGLAEPLAGQRAWFNHFLEAYLAGHVAVLKPSSRAAFRSYARHLKREFSGHRLDQVNVQAAQLVVAHLAARGLARSTIHAIVAFLRRLLRAARHAGIAAAQIGSRELTLPKETRPQRTPRAFSLLESQQILAAADWPWRALYALQAFLGLRCGEALGIEWADIDFGAKVVRVRQQASHGRIATTKSTNSAAALPLPEPLAAILRAYRAAWTPNEAGLLFANRRGHPFWASGVRRHHLHRLLKRLAIPAGGFHAWRHGLATEAFRSGAGAAAVRALLRHGNIATTMKYSAVSFDDLVRSSNAVAQRIHSTPEETQRCGLDDSPTTAFMAGAGDGALNSRSEGT